jgi:hypothetical protein
LFLCILKIPQNGTAFVIVETIPYLMGAALREEVLNPADAIEETGLRLMVTALILCIELGAVLFLDAPIQITPTLVTMAAGELLFVIVGLNPSLLSHLIWEKSRQNVILLSALKTTRGILQITAAGLREKNSKITEEQTFL